MRCSCPAPLAPCRRGDFATATVDRRRFQRVNEKDTLYVGALTSLQSGTVGEDVPKYLQYRLGDANSIRGQDFHFGKTLYGKNQLITTVEYQISVVRLKPYNFFKDRRYRGSCLPDIYR